eukprot:2635003-Rhodomonas_salina.4
MFPDIELLPAWRAAIYFDSVRGHLRVRCFVRASDDTKHLVFRSVVVLDGKRPARARCGVIRGLRSRSEILELGSKLRDSASASFVLCRHHPFGTTDLTRSSRVVVCAGGCVGASSLHRPHHGLRADVLQDSQLDRGGAGGRGQDLP